MLLQFLKREWKWLLFALYSSTKKRRRLATMRQGHIESRCFGEKIACWTTHPTSTEEHLFHEPSNLQQAPDTPVLERSILTIPKALLSSTEGCQRERQARRVSERCVQVFLLTDAVGWLCNLGIWTKSLFCWFSRCNNTPSMHKFSWVVFRCILCFSRGRPNNELS